jgi:hypothetical protein
MCQAASTELRLQLLASLLKLISSKSCPGPALSCSWPVACALVGSRLLWLHSSHLLLLPLLGLLGLWLLSWLWHSRHRYMRAAGSVCQAAPTPGALSAAGCPRPQNHVCMCGFTKQPQPAAPLTCTVALAMLPLRHSCAVDRSADSLMSTGTWMQHHSTTPDLTRRCAGDKQAPSCNCLLASRVLLVRLSIA